MAGLYCDGFGHYATADFAAKGWQQTAQANGAMAVSSSGGRFTGQGSLTYTTTSTINNAARIDRTFTAGASWVVGFAFKASQIPTSVVPAIFALRDAGSVQIDLRINTAGTLSLTRAGSSLTGGTSTNTLSTGLWYYIEVKVTIANSIAADSCKVRVNGSDWITVSAGQDTQATANASANQVQLGNHNGLSSSGVTYTYGDLYVCDQAGAVNNNFKGNRRVITLLPNGAGNSGAWSPSAGSNYQCVDDTAPNGDTDYNSTSTAGAVDTYAYPALGVSPSAIDWVQTCIDQRKDDAGARITRPVTRSGGADYEGSDYTVTDSYMMDCQLRETDPATAAAWTEAGVGAAEWGVKLQS